MPGFDLPWRQISKQGAGDPHGEEPVKRASRTMRPAAILRDARLRALLRMRLRSWQSCSAQAHRPGMTVLERAVDHDFDQFRSGPAERGFERGRDILWLRDPHRLQPERLCKAGEIHLW